jgi:hypothetical protein
MSQSYADRLAGKSLRAECITIAFGSLVYRQSQLLEGAKRSAFSMTRSEYLLLSHMGPALETNRMEASRHRVCNGAWADGMVTLRETMARRK